MIRSYLVLIRHLSKPRVLRRIFKPYFRKIKFILDLYASPRSAIKELWIIFRRSIYGYYRITREIVGLISELYRLFTLPIRKDASFEKFVKRVIAKRKGVRVG